MKMNLNTMSQRLFDGQVSALKNQSKNEIKEQIDSLESRKKDSPDGLSAREESYFQELKKHYSK